MTAAIPPAPRLISARLAAAGARHGFFGRAGGVSDGIYTSLNCGPGSDDQPEAVAENRRRCCEAIGVQSVATLHQIHSSLVVTVEAPFEGAPPQADAVVTARPGFAIGVLSADCMPLLFIEPDAQVIGAAHAGWRGALAGVIEASIDAMARLGARPARIVAALGPCLRRDNFEVGQDLVKAFTDKYPDAARFFSPAPAPPFSAGKSLFDAAAFAAWRLGAAGLDIGNFDDLPICTLARPEDYFSHRGSVRRGEPDYGRNLSAIAMWER